MSDALLISVRFHEGWYHGSEAEPTPARIFQALVAGAGISGPLDTNAVSALTWLERLERPPIVAIPSTLRGQAVVNYVPNNDLDSKRGDHRRIGEIRTKKRISPLLFDPETPFLFAWSFETAEAEGAQQICELADRVYQLGRTVDMAWAWGEVLSSDDLAERLNSYPGLVRYPSSGTGTIDCPTPGSLESLNRRYAAAATRFDSTADRKGQTFSRRPKPKWKKVNYEGVGSQFMLELRRVDDSGFAPWPLERAARLVELLRDSSVEKLKAALPERGSDIDRVLIGRKPNGSNSGPTSARVRIIPLPSIGHPQADMQIRRVLVDVPAECPLRADDISWALSGLQLTNPALQEAIDVTRSGNLDQLRHYVSDKPARRWRSVTPVALPAATRRRIDPRRKNAAAKAGQEKYKEHVTASFAVAQALRHAGIAAEIRSVRVQREPFDKHGRRVESFAEGTRFKKHGLWHVDLELETPVKGPLVIGNGRFCGLGLMKLVRTTSGVFAFSIESGLRDNADPVRLSRALRRAVMARVRDVLGSYRLPAFFTGHHEDGATARSEEEPHLAFLFDPRGNNLFVVTPDYLDRTWKKGTGPICRNGPEGAAHKLDPSPFSKRRWNSDQVATLELALHGFDDLRAGADGHLRIRPVSIELDRHPLFATSHIWESLTPYHVNRHAKRSTAETTLTNDLIADCERRGLPRPDVTVLDWTTKSGVGLSGNVRLTFKHAVHGPITLGKTRHVGGGVFSVVNQTTK